MNRWIPVLIAALTVFVGCGDCGEDPPSDPSPDATDVIDTTADTSEDTQDQDVADATDTSDTADTADTADAADVSPPTATVTVIWGEEPAEGVRVIAHDPDAAVTGDVATDEAGEAVVEVTEGSIVTLIDAPPNDYTRYLTLQDIDPGDSVELELAPNASPNRTLDVELPGSFSGASSYEVHGGCNYRSALDASNTITLGIRPPCTEDDVDLLALAKDSDENVIAYTNAETIQATSGTTTVSLDSWKTDVLDADLEVTGLPASSDYDSSLRALLYNDYERWGVARVLGQTAGASSIQQLWSIPPDIADELVMSYRLRTTDADTGAPMVTAGAEYFSDRSSPASASIEATDLSPFISSLTVEDRDTAQPLAEWSATPVVTGGATADASDAAFLRVIWTGNAPTSANSDGPSGEQPGVSPGAINSWVVV
ncbi:MAG: hypothetical protein ACQEVA_19040, partial [Myxococcota bacterium]